MRKNYQKGSILLWVVAITVIVVVIVTYTVIKNNGSSNSSTEQSHVSVADNTITATQNQSVDKINGNTAVTGTQVPKMTTGFANNPAVIVSRLAALGYPVNSAYNNFSDLIADMKLKNSSVAKILGNVNVGGLNGYEVSINNKAGAWVLKDSILYTYYFDEIGPLSVTNKQTLASLVVGQ